MYTRTLSNFRNAAGRLASTECIKWKVSCVFSSNRLATSHNAKFCTEISEMKQRYHLKLTLQRNPLGKLSLVGIHTPQPALHKAFEPHKVTTIASVDVPHIDRVKTSVSEPSSMDKSLPVEADEDLDILAAMDDPPVLEQFASMPLPSHTYTLASYVEHSVTLQKLVELGVDLSKVEKKEGIPTELLKMDFETDIQEKLIYLNGIGVAGEKLGRFVTRNPHILLEEVEELQVRVDYLKSKKFSDVAISQIVNRAPYFLSFSVLRVDRKLGYLQQLLDLKGTEVREVITKEPRLVTFKVSKIQENVFVLREQLGFRKSELKSLIIKEPKLLLRGKERMIGVFDYVHNVMEISHQVLLHTPKVFASRLHKIQERHQFLKSINRDNYDSTQPQYIPLEKLSRVPDSIFCDEIAKKPLEEYNAFLKTL